jgi:hypothetical protein
VGLLYPIAVFLSLIDVLVLKKWRWAFEEHKMWSPHGGITGNVDIEYLKTLLQVLEQTG